MKCTYAMQIDAPPEDVFSWISDRERLLQWIPNLVEYVQTVDKDGGVGSRFRQVYVENGRRMEMEGEVVEFERNRRLGCDIRGKVFDLSVHYQLEDLGGRTLLTQSSEVRFNSAPMKIISVLMQPLIKKSSLKQVESSFSKLKYLIESGGAQSGRSLTD